MSIYIFLILCFVSFSVGCIQKSVDNAETYLVGMVKLIKNIIMAHQLKTKNSSTVPLFLFILLSTIGVIDSNVELWRCGKSFLDLPTIFMKDQQYVDVCIPLSEDVMTLDDVKCGTDVAHACLGVRYLKEYNVPLYAGAHFQNTPDVVLGLSRTNNYPKGRPIGMVIPNDDGKSPDSDESVEKNDNIRRSELSAKSESPVVWSEAAWSNGELNIDHVFKY